MVAELRITARNEFTLDDLITGPASKEYCDGWDRIFAEGKKKRDAERAAQLEAERAEEAKKIAEFEATRDKNEKTLKRNAYTVW